MTLYDIAIGYYNEMKKYDMNVNHQNDIRICDSFMSGYMNMISGCDTLIS